MYNQDDEAQAYYNAQQAPKQYKTNKGYDTQNKYDNAYNGHANMNRSNGHVKMFNVREHLVSMGIEDTDKWLQEYKELFK